MKIFWGSIIIALLLQACNNKNNNTSETNADTITSEIDPNVDNNDTATAVERNSQPVSPADKPEFDKLIVPGERIGKTELNSDADKLEDLLGKPNLSDAAMGKAWLTWYGKKDEHNNQTQLNIYTAYKDTGMRERTVQQIHITSSYFATENDIHVYSALTEIKNVFPQIQKVAQYKDEGRDIVIYDAVQQGIAFEIAGANKQDICTGIIVHEKTKKVTDTYVMLHPDMQKL